MRITSLSKKIIVVITAVTFALVALAGLVPQGEKVQKEALDVLTETKSSEVLNKQKQEQALIRSLTNFSHDIDEDALNNNETLYTGYIKGAGNAIFRFNAQAGQLLVAELAEAESQLFELLLFSNYTSSVLTLISGESYTIPDNGLYELRIVFRTHIESVQAVEAENHQAVPQIFNLTFKLN